jgi:hypothetical protein
MRMKESNKTPEVTPRPEDFPLGSAESRAAARAMAEREPVIRVIVEHIGSGVTEIINVWGDSR